ncbi:putative mitochondrial phospholipid:diacylglycerol acyltransferase [Leptomonas pyrrhocoris]|uniref:Putative mitochondrial phospholipid:diacylglycerol acyltransferase n=1 Tax=Leptomonas pyrrhocoris TaxID=157538 RepID=A0A0N0DTK8_LEPPY|nr:putative mitochondrial phospholipid:diacylglycerol acyltransferase [Leptomonas pyrrhocoris]XP_015656078.1 putative mitochondrial phospholipid:diacylglycerol acyltransferase [Leptomonas pyrrhocoris]KPA77638.1 putative mitochondrial phospholipid:diacylglycerol acyltransferase [Leptomonas pyrrhocoris]KPA77639.1 putative mitochondrial phospholipid:diacylglycerol acyltransferase [Leptomonas pyrrhocoris]|eukprot:XP_015656077.1 putative mitochondrial phospholipid:diacylglycerol acyltransferase [Leptomonas pyrrhocoris]
MPRRRSPSLDPRPIVMHRRPNRRHPPSLPSQHAEEHVEPSAQTVSAMQVHGVQQSVPVLDLQSSVDALHRPPAIEVSPAHPRVSAAGHNMPAGDRKDRRASAAAAAVGKQSWWRRFLGFMFQREDFLDFDTATTDRTSASDITRAEQRTASVVERLRVPGWMKHIIFDMLDFWMRKRVHFVVLLLAVLLYFIVPQGVMEDVTRSFAIDEETRPGRTFFAKYNHGDHHLPRRHPVAIIPGFITGALEVWETSLPCVRNSTLFSGFRQRMFGSQMLLMILTDPHCWLQLFSMDPKTGLDKAGTKVRADTGFTSVDFFVPGYWVWAKILINLADIGYDPQSMAVMSYDWRLSPRKAHDRDGFFFQLRNSIRFLCQKNRRRAVVISHSYGATVAVAFFRWAEQRESGFMDRHVAYYVNLGGTTMGTAKATSSLLFGDAKDTLSIPAPARRALDTFVSQESRYRFMRTMSCLVSMLPLGCEELWPDLVVLPNGTSLSTRGTAELIRDECTHSGHEDCARETSYLLETIDDLPVLPQAPNTTVACLYGVGVPAEAGYYLRENSDPNSRLRYVVNNSWFDNTSAYGVRFTDGDETVPLLSLAYMCRAVNGWSRNVGRVITREYNHNVTDASPLDLRGGPRSGRHVDILGNFDMLEDILKIASGVDEMGGEPGQDEFEYADESTGQSVTLQRRVRDRIYSDVDFQIRRNARACLRKKNTPIQPKAVESLDADNEFVWSGIPSSPPQKH